MAHDYISLDEKNRREDSKKQREAMDKSIAERNARLVGEPKEYKGVMYQMKQNGMYECLNASEGNQLTGLFTSPQAIKKHIDELEMRGDFNI